jgi:hypothetical protein
MGIGCGVGEAELKRKSRNMQTSIEIESFNCVE